VSADRCLSEEPVVAGNAWEAEAAKRSVRRLMRRRTPERGFQWSRPTLDVPIWILPYEAFWGYETELDDDPLSALNLEIEEKWREAAAPAVSEELDAEVRRLEERAASMMRERTTAELEPVRSLLESAVKRARAMLKLPDK
jgi:hypothetical protein